MRKRKWLHFMLMGVLAGVISLSGAAAAAGESALPEPNWDRTLESKLYGFP
ncbi:hypothetical protein D3C76_348700 [compost metagenome]